MSWTEPGMVTSSGSYMTLSNSDVHIEIDEMIATITTTHTYTNTEKTNIEAVYTFPIPREAVLLLMQATIGDRTLKGYYVEREEATRTYEKAISDGDSAVLVEHVEAGMQSMSVGNIMAGESVTVTVKYGLVLRWNADTVRMQLPSTISPRYGAPPPSRPAFLEPVISMFQKNTMRPNIVIRGILASTSVSSPSHKFQYRFDRERGELIASSTGPIVMDRDLILTFTSTTAERSWALAVPDGDTTVVLGGINITVPKLNERRHPIEVMYVIDCSGSMAGSSIASAKFALIASLRHLTPHDRVNAVAFGSTSSAFAMQSILAEGEPLDRLIRWCGDLDADMGGTDAEGALDVALSMMRRGSILFITDGEVNNWEQIVTKAKSQNVRIFTIGIGSAPNMSFVDLLASTTGGACEFIAPEEGVDRAVARHTARILNTGSSTFELPSDGVIADQWTDIQHDIVYDGDTVLYTSRYNTAPRLLSITRKDGLALGKATVRTSSDPEICRIAASLRLPNLSDTEAKALALKHQLLSKHTSCLVVDVRVAEEKADSLPELRRVAQTLSAGWGGMGYSGETCPICQGHHVLRNGACVVCMDCGITAGDAAGSSYTPPTRVTRKFSSYSMDSTTDLMAIKMLKPGFQSVRGDRSSGFYMIPGLGGAVDRNLRVLISILEDNLSLVHSITFDEFFRDAQLSSLRSSIQELEMSSVSELDMIRMILYHLLTRHVSELSAGLRQELLTIDLTS